MEQEANLDCGFTKNNNWFRYRAAAIILENDCVLMASNEMSDYFYSVGGGVQLGETAAQAVVREVYEETGIRYDIDRLVFIHENFFSDSGLLAGLQCHEIAFYFLMKPQGLQGKIQNGFCPAGKESVHWIPLKDLKSKKAYPSFFAEKLGKLPLEVEHIITREAGEE